MSASQNDPSTPCAPARAAKAAIAPQSEPGEVILDLDILALNTMGMIEIQREVFELMFEQIPQSFCKMQEALEAQDRSTWSMNAHSIKGSSRNMGWQALAALAARAESGTQTIELLSEMRAVFDRSECAARAHLAAHESDIAGRA
ncbi:MAG: Hpt domain-containing protein [Neomegalonema sp.]|nr:Hpt domain-containing protein [Neomegalonema sp.]